MTELIKSLNDKIVGLEEAQKELDKLQLEMEQTGEVVENIKSKYNEDEFQAAFLENCEVAKKMLEIGEGLQDIGE